MNCGFLSWVDEEWEPTLQKSLTRLWGMHSDIHNSLDCEREQNNLVLHNLADEKRKLEEKYTSLLADVKKYMEETNKRVVQENYNTIRKKSKTDLGDMEKENIDLKNEVGELKNDVCWLKKVQRTQADIMKARQKNGLLKKLLCRRRSHCLRNCSSSRKMDLMLPRIKWLGSGKYVTSNLQLMSSSTVFSKNCAGCTFVTLRPIFMCSFPYYSSRLVLLFSGMICTFRNVSYCYADADLDIYYPLATKHASRVSG